MAENDRIYDLLGRMEKTINLNHTEVLTRITVLEAKNHTPDDCPAAKRIEKRIDKSELEAKDNAWKAMAKEAMRVMAMIATALGVNKWV